MKKIGLLMGCFNPVHNDHLDLASAVLKQNLVDEIWFVPAKDNLNIKDNKTISSYHRLAMLNLIIDDYPNCRIHEIEVNNNKQNYTFETLKELKNKNNELYLIIGSDNLKTFNKWNNYTEILENYYLIVAARNKDNINKIIDENKNINKYKSKIIKAKFNSKSISSTFIRNNNKEKIKTMIPEKVRDYIIKNQLYEGSAN